MKFGHLFDWPSRHEIHLALPIMLVLSVGLHVAGLFVFQVVHPRARAGQERSAEVYYLAPGSPEAVKLAPMLAASDPSLFSPAHTTGKGVWKLPETTYTPSFDASPPQLLALPPSRQPNLVPRVSSLGPVSREAGKRPVSPPAAGLPTAVSFDGELSGRTVTPPPGFSFAVIPADGLKILSPAEYLIAVSPDGRPLYFFPRESSGSETLDRAALRYLAGARFSPAPDTTNPAWGMATFHWGTDVLAPNQP